MWSLWRQVKSSILLKWRFSLQFDRKVLPSWRSEVLWGWPRDWSGPLLCVFWLPEVWLCAGGRIILPSSVLCLQWVWPSHPGQVLHHRGGQVAVWGALQAHQAQVSCLSTACYGEDAHSNGQAVPPSLLHLLCLLSRAGWKTFHGWRRGRPLQGVLCQVQSSSMLQVWTSHSVHCWQENDTYHLWWQELSLPVLFMQAMWQKLEWKAGFHRWRGCGLWRL